MPKWLKWTLGGIAGLIVLSALFGGDPESKDKQTATAASKPAKASVTRKSVALKIAAPDRDITVHRAKVEVSGTSEPGATVQVDGVKVTVDAVGRWHRTMDFGLGENDFIVSASKPGLDQATEPITITRHRTAAQSRAFRRAQAIKRARRLAAKRRAAAVRAARRRAAAAARVANFKAAATSIAYKQLAKNPDRHAGEKVKYTGQIFQIQEDGGKSIILLSVTNEGYGLWDDHIWINYPGTIKGAEDDIITVYGTVVGEKSYETQIGGETYVPEVDAKYIEE
jgi:hypothetical protein